MFWNAFPSGTSFWGNYEYVLEKSDVKAPTRALRQILDRNNFLPLIVDSHIPKVCVGFKTNKIYFLQGKFSTANTGRDQNLYNSTAWTRIHGRELVWVDIRLVSTRHRDAGNRFLW